MSEQESESQLAPRPANREEVEQAIRETICKVLLVEPEQASALDFSKTGVLQSLGVTSIDAFELIVSVEERFGFEFADHELNPGLVDPLQKLADLSWDKLAAVAQPCP